jgi:peptidoglycan/xylan/chitin deacetylase (PgdA/CDA1 family)
LDGVDRNAARILRRLVGALAAGDILLLHDNRPTVLAVLPDLLERVAAQGLTSVTLATALRDGRAV